MYILSQAQGGNKLFTAYETQQLVTLKKIGDY